ncbi:IS1 family transposase [Haemophilus haemoglobinophilus]|nr:IS1 family transposase [Canicola haemoglobinophilus]MBN6712076.1 IS1 family transposase [Canicola haemoglobinophilus]
MKCPRCQGLNIKKNGFNSNRKQKYYCRICKRCFIGDHALNNKSLDLNPRLSFKMMSIQSQ